MPATNTRDTAPLPLVTPPPRAMASVATRIFEALGALHHLAEKDAALLERAAAGLRFIQSSRAYSPIERKLFGIAVAELSPRDAFVVEAAACYAAEKPMYLESSGSRQATCTDERRALWLAAVLRLADAMCSQGPHAADGVFAAWTDAELYLEFDGAALTPAQLARAARRTAALEAISARRVTIAHAEVRRGAA